VGWFNGVVVFTIIWWVVFFCVLPIGIRPAGESDRGHDAGAPANPRIALRALVTTGIALVLFAVAWWVITSDFYSFRTE
jgi:predicted secreted protein